MNNDKFNLGIIAFTIALVAAFGIGFITRDLLDSPGTEFGVFNEAFKIIQDHGYREMPGEPIIEYGAIQGMIDAYGDPHTRFIEPVQAELSDDTLAGGYGGIGAQLGRDDEGLIVLYPFPDGPAAEAGLSEGDRLIKVNQFVILADTPLDDVIAEIRGPEGKSLQITIARPPGYNEIEFTVKRKSIPLPSVTHHLDAGEPRIGLLDINVIAASTPDEIINAVTDLETRGAEFYILDLRGNGGGMLKEGVEIARLFLSYGDIIQYQYKGKKVKTYKVQTPGPLEDIPLAVFVDAYTASAAEIISGAIQKHKRGPLIGTNTYGKDTIQLVFDLQDESSLHITSAMWWIPGLEPPIGDNGLIPDIMISSENSGNEDQFMENAIAYFHSN